MHYEILILYTILILSACPIRCLSGGDVPGSSLLVIGLGLLLLAPTLRAVPQPNLQSLAALRAVPGIKVLFEADSGWCTYYVPHCEMVFAGYSPSGPTFTEMVSTRHPDAIMLSDLMRTTRSYRSEPLYRELEADPGSHGYDAIALPGPLHRTLLVKRSAPPWK